MAKNDKYLEPVVHTYPGGDGLPPAIVRMRYPDISDEENDRRCEAAMDQAVNFVLALRKIQKEAQANDRTAAQSG